MCVGGGAHVSPSANDTFLHLQNALRACVFVHTLARHEGWPCQRWPPTRLAQTREHAHRQARPFKKT